MTGFPALLLTLAALHGGVYRRPIDTSPPAASTDPTGSTPTAPTPFAPSSGGSVSPSSGATVDHRTHADWRRWWELSKEPYLGLHERRSIAAEGTSSGTAPSPELISKRVVPALRRALAAQDSTDLVTGALVALARVGDDLPAEESRALADAIQPFLSDSNQEIAETAALALGILGDESAAPVLADLLLDTKSGRKRVGDSEVPRRTRAFAAYSLGLIGHASDREDVRRFVVHALDRALAEDESATPDLGAACVLAIARVPLAWSGTIPNEKELDLVPPTASREAQVVHLAQLLEIRDLDEGVRGQVPVSLARLVADAPTSTELSVDVARLLLELQGKRRTEPLTRFSCVQAFGILADADDGPVDRALRQALRRAEDDEFTRYIAKLSLGTVGGRPGDGTQARDGDVRAQLLRKLGRARGDEARWTALALGLLERANPSAEDDIERALRLALDDARTAVDLGAFSIACALARDANARELLLRKLEKTGDDAARGYLALALAMIGATEAIPSLHEIVETAEHRPALMRDTALALALLGDEGLGPRLVEKLAGSRSLSARASIAQALGRVGSAASVDPLLELLESDSSPAARAFAAVALGLVADTDELPWSVPFALDMNYVAAEGRTPTLIDDKGLGLLNIY